MIFSFLLLSLRFNYQLPRFDNQKFFKQKLDHFNLSDHTTFDQLYYEDYDYFDSENPRIILYIGGEATLSFGDSSIKKGPIEDLANITHSYFAALEHRFYGISAPKIDLTTEVLTKYLTSIQALDDLALFLKDRKKVVCKEHTDCPVLIIGGSYAGTLSSMFRMKYPHLANFSWASSPPLTIKLDFPEYDMHVSQAIKNYSEDCHTRSVELMQEIETNADSFNKFRENTNFKKSVDRVSTLSEIADLFAGIVQYDSRTNAIKDYCDRNINTLDDFIQFFNEQDPEPDDGDALLLFNSSYNQPIDYKNSRAWTFQTCNEFGWFQTASGEFRSKEVNIEYYNRICQAAFNLTVPDVTDMNIRYGLTHPQSTNVIFANGLTDPWSIISIPENYEDVTFQQYNYHIAGGSHCSELSSNPNESHDLISKRKKMFEIVQEWMEFNVTKCSVHGEPHLSKCICKYSWSGVNCDKRTVKEKIFKLFSSLVVCLPTFMMIGIGVAAWILFKKEQQEPEIKTIIS
ncbi:Clan SC, family S28, unassigned serine peptidase [Tritrichomonas foetus]|uniref:Clan SC, family S28, unassigned serine peptidase n=1 Tax=Tritrichomonas foetus TaxID=1144522 RepID=A0A1J4KJJ9_9EUKA|nr:Clan SC, family S28, unassigned serine peptidase [Tritrichomonas foetus]|eukprot:OHT11120.1 Clan SC, family S28, unassigned serine peptidase [Tritrichomonas foetus]